MRSDGEPDNAGVVCSRRAVVRTVVMMMVMVMGMVMRMVMRMVMVMVMSRSAPGYGCRV